MTCCSPSCSGKNK
uniref:Uncharacterized protein n=1 Tax=Arundo donax TaxID=35708 RepID=A0A0A9F839_ARUDO